MTAHTASSTAKYQAPVAMYMTSQMMPATTLKASPNWYRLRSSGRTRSLRPARSGSGAPLTGFR